MGSARRPVRSQRGLRASPRATGTSIFLPAQFGCKIYDRAEASFSRALDADPSNFDPLFNLGLAPLRVGHTERAASAFKIALNERPEDIDCLFALSQTYLQRERAVEAATLLTKAERLAPGRADIPLLLAQVSAHLEFYLDAAASYDRYLKHVPGDEGSSPGACIRPGNGWPVQARLTGSQRIRAQSSAGSPKLL